MAKYSINQIKEAYIQKRDWEKQFPVSYFLFRPVSFYLTYLVMRITDSPSSIAWVGFAVGLSGCLAFLFIPQLKIWTGILLLTIFALLDAVDGNIARVTKNVTYYGKYIDGVIGIAIDGSYCFWLGLGLYLKPSDFYMLNFSGLRYNSNTFFLLAGAIIMTGRLYSSIFEANYDILLIQKKKRDGSFQGNLTQDIQSSIYRRHRWYLLFININAFNLQLLILALCTAFKIIHLFLLFFAVYYIFRLLVIMAFYLYKGRKDLN